MAHSPAPLDGLAPTSRTSRGIETVIGRIGEPILAEIAVELDRALAFRREHGTPGGTAPRILARGNGWTVADVMCTSGPRDHVFEERHPRYSIGSRPASTIPWRCGKSWRPTCQSGSTSPTARRRPGSRDGKPSPTANLAPQKGRELEFAELLGYLKARRVRNVVWLTADVHYCAAHFYDPGKAAFRDFDPFWEFVAGPLNAGSFGPNTLDATFGPQVVFVKAPPPGQSNLSPYSGCSSSAR